MLCEGDRTRPEGVFSTENMALDVKGQSRGTSRSELQISDSQISALAHSPAGVWWAFREGGAES